jgi:hypothetical protein
MNLKKRGLTVEVDTVFGGQAAENSAQMFSMPNLTLFSKPRSRGCSFKVNCF